MAEAIVSIILALISYFGSKKAGASDGEAALIAAGVGAGSYYVSTQTEWGKDVISKLEGNFQPLKGADGQPLKNTDNSVASAPAGATAVLDSNGNPKKDASGNILWKLVDSSGKVLTSWGPVGTAGVIGTAAVASKASSIPSYVWLGAAGVAALVILK